MVLKKVTSDLQFGLVMYSRMAAMMAKQVYLATGSTSDDKLDEKKTVIDEVKCLRIQALLSKVRIGVSLDEFHTIKNPDSYTGKAFRALRTSFRFCFGATATAFMANIYDVYHLVSYLNPAIFGKVEDFNANFLIRKSKTIYLGGGRRRQVHEVEGYKNVERLQEAIATVIYSYFPPVDLEFIRHAARLEDTENYMAAAQGVFSADANDTDFNEKRHSSRLLDLQEVVNRDLGKLRTFDNVLKQRLGQGTLLFCSYYKTIAVVERLLTLRNIPYKEISGRIADRRVVRDWFVRNPQGKVLLITRAGGQSLNLQATPNIIFYDIPFGLGYFLQAMGRVVREFSDFNKFVIDFICVEGTIDDYKYNLIASNKDILMKLFRNELVPPSDRMTDFSQQIIDGLKKEFLWKPQGAGKSKAA